MKRKEGDIKMEQLIETNKKLSKEVTFLEKKLQEQTIKLIKINKLLKKQNYQIKANQSKLQYISETKNKFFSIIAHDLKNPFNALLGFSNYLEKTYDKSDDSKRKKYISFIKDSGDKLHRLINNLVEWSNAQRGKTLYNPQNIHIKNIFKEVIALTAPFSKDKNISISINDKTDMMAYADVVMISAVIKNLLSNAIKYTTEGGAINISSKITNTKIEISIMDNGVGIKPENLNKLFKLGEKVQTPGTNKELGTGLGLLLCKEYINKHNSKIWANSEVDKGSTFTFTLPLPKK